MGLWMKLSFACQGQEAQTVESWWGFSPIPLFLESSQLLTLITAHSEGLSSLWFLKDKYGKNLFHSPTLPGSAAAHSQLGSSHPPLQVFSLSPAYSPNLSTFKVLQQTSTAFPCSKVGWHKSWCGWFSSLSAPGRLDPTLQPPSTGEFPHPGYQFLQVQAG